MGQVIAEEDSRAGMLSGDRFEHHWQSIAEQLDYIPHIWATWWTKEALREGVLNGRFQCWAAGDESRITVVAFSQIADYPANRIFQVFLAFGQGIDEVAPVLEAVWEQFAAKSGCSVGEVTGRPGWGPRLRKLGFRQQSCTFTRSVSNLRIN